MGLIDIGANLCGDAFKDDIDETLEKAIEHQVTTIIVTGTSEAFSEKALELAHRYPDLLYATAGIHPHDASAFGQHSYNNLKALLTDEKVVAVGETGLDFNRDFSPREQQLSVFEKHLELASETQKPLFLHERDAHNKLFEVLTHYRDSFNNAVVHCFTGSKTELFRYLDLDLYIGITGWICDERRGKTLADIVHNIPLNRLMIETDAPYLIPRDIKNNPYQLTPAPPKSKSRRNEPCYLPHIAAAIAHCYDKDTAEIATHTSENSRLFFQLNSTSDSP